MAHTLHKCVRWVAAQNTWTSTTEPHENFTDPCLCTLHCYFCMCS
jgi:hypothetical protein